MYIILNFYLLFQVCILHQIKISKMHFKKFFFTGICAIVLIFTCNESRSQDTAKIMSYNLLNYSGNNTTKDPYFRQTMDYEKPDVLAVCEILSQAAVNNYLANVLNFNNPNKYSAGIFIDGPDTDNAIFYDNSKFHFVSNTVISTELRNINMFTLIHINSNDTIKIFDVHLKASNTTDDQQKRLAEVNLMRNVTNTFRIGEEFMVVGDFNIYSSTEPAYQRLLQPDVNADGQFVDMFNMTGSWNQSSYAPFHTQSTRTRAIGDGGATGGLDDRFDMILNSNGLLQEGKIKYIPGSLVSVGNDGNHFNDSINKQPNTAVPDSIANALYYTSDHLPVYAKYKFDANPISVSNISSEIPEGFKLSQNYPNPFNPNTRIDFDIPDLRPYGSFSNHVTLKIYDILGNEVETLVDENLSEGEYTSEFNASGLSSGSYFYRLSAGNFTLTRSMTLIK